MLNIPYARETFITIMKELPVFIVANVYPVLDIIR